MFQLLNKIVAIASIANPTSRAPSVALSRAVSPAPITDNAQDPSRGYGCGQGRTRARSTRASRASSLITSRTNSRSSRISSTEPYKESEEEKVTVRSVQYRKHNQRPNLYTSIYYPTFIAEYSLGTNLNILIGESIHRIFKEMIYKTNYRNLERDLLQRINFEITVRFLLLSCSQISSCTINSYVVEQLQRIQKKCPNLFSTLLLASKRTIIQRQILSNANEQDLPAEYTTTILEDSAYINIKARSKLAVKQSRQNLQLLQFGREVEKGFYIAITIAFAKDYEKPNITIFYKVLLQQQKTVLFDDP